MSIFDDFYADSEDPIDLFGTHSNREAAELTRTLAAEGRDLQRTMFEQLMADRAPVGAARDNALMMLGGIQDGTFTPPRTPGFEYRLNESLDDLNASQAARGKFNSGETAIARQDMTAGAVANDYNETVNRLLNTAGFSTSDLNTNNSILQNNVGQQSNQLMELGRVNANNVIGNTNSRNAMINSGAGVAGYFSSGFGNRNPSLNQSNISGNGSGFAGYA